MTSSRYLLARFAQAFGYFRRSQRMGDAASEMHLLREAEAQLGMMIWGNVEGIEALSVEYWNLRKLIKERDEIRARLAACQERLDKAHEERSDILNNTPEENQDLLEERTELLMRQETLSQQRDKIVVEAREVRRAYTGLKTKLEVFVEENNASAEHHEAIEQIKSRLSDLKTRFADLKQQRLKIGQQIAAGDSEVDQVDEKLKEVRQARRLMASEAFRMIGEGNQEISLMRAESALIDTRMRQLYAEIGRYVSRNTQVDPACAAAAASHRGLVDVMRALRRSIALNHRLAGNQ